MTDIKIRSFKPGDRDWVVDAHQAYYATAHGFDSTFGVLVGEILDNFLAAHDPYMEAGWIATQGERRLGCIFCVRIDADVAKLRLFFLSDSARGKGLGKELLGRCMGFAKARGYQEMRLWTHEEQRAAGALYAKAGWTLCSAESVVSFGVPLVEQHWRVWL